MKFVIFFLIVLSLFFAELSLLDWCVVSLFVLCFRDLFATVRLRVWCLDSEHCKRIQGNQLPPMKPLSLGGKACLESPNRLPEKLPYKLEPFSHLRCLSMCPDDKTLDFSAQM